MNVELNIVVITLYSLILTLSGEHIGRDVVHLIPAKNKLDTHSYNPFINNCI